MSVLVSAAGLLGALTVAWTACRSPSWAVALVAASVPLQGFARVGSSDTGVTWTQAWLWSFLAVGALLFAAGMLYLRFDLVTNAFAAVVACYIVSRHAATVEPLWRNEVYRWSAVLAFFVVARALLRKSGGAGPLSVVTAFGAIWTGIAAVIQVVGDSGPASFQRGGRPRAYATFGEPNTFGAFAAGCLVVLVASLLFSPANMRRRTTTVSVGGCALAAVGLGLSQSRGAIAAAGLVLGGMLLLKFNGQPQVNRTVRGIAVAAMVVVGMVMGPPVARQVARGDAAVEVTSATWADRERLAHWGAATRMVVRSDGLGVGAGHFDVHYREVTPSWRFRIPQGHAHDAYLQVAAEAGLVGAGVYFALIVAAVATLARRRRPAGSPVAVAIALAATGVFALHNLVDYLHVLNLPLILVAWWTSALAQSEGSATTP